MQGQRLIKKLSKELRCTIHAWTGKVFAFPNAYPDGDPFPEPLRNKFFVEGDKKKTNIPAVTELGMVVMAALVIAAAAVVIKRRRAMMT